jgi:hypothetical protein
MSGVCVDTVYSFYFFYHKGADIFAVCVLMHL